MNVSLAGEWTCRLDPDNRGRAEKWYEHAIDECAVNLPGTTQTNRIGPAASKKLISNLTPETEYLGPAWYQRDVHLSAADCERHTELFLEREKDAIRRVMSQRRRGSLHTVTLYATHR